MKNAAIKCAAAALATLAFAGCWTLSRTETPETGAVRAPESAPALCVDGFISHETAYTPSYGWSTVYVEHGYSHRHGHFGHYETVPVTTFIPQTYESDAYARMARQGLEDCGYIVNGPSAAYIVSGEFDGPYSPEGSDTRAALIDIGSVFFALYEATEWGLDLRIREASSGRVVFSKRLWQEYGCCAFSPLWLFGLAAHEETDPSWQSAWCKTMLVRKAVAEASAYFRDAQEGKSGK